MSTEILNVGDVFFAYIVVRDAEGEQSDSDDIAYTLLLPNGTTGGDAPAAATSDDLDAINADNAMNPDWTDLTSTTGVYVANIELSQAGNWWLRWAATDPVQLARQQAFFVFDQRA